MLASYFARQAADYSFIPNLSLASCFCRFTYYQQNNRQNILKRACTSTISVNKVFGSSTVSLANFEFTHKTSTVFS
ncbi:hypothetical protein DMR_29230 [Solidesulfovibrio magneticus RS-1]|uniref:Uncharacterized protein n=1 Tax=Solidesulfovibrio magneticus (strain ATCC 700980 / DSM 13731 / RS-1) TaxID=573370 RepID=C4XHP0_SOLM1|nr:hypothetical protein DMR_29230 [Solidesulfovibrio magneticus RS-1]